MNSRLSQISFLIRLAFLMLGSFILLSGCGGGPEKPSAPQKRTPTVRVDTAQSKNLVYYDRYPATVTPLETVELRPQTSGYITEKHFRDGDFVRRGQRLFTVDTRRYVADVERAAADVNAAKSSLALAQKNLARYERLAAAEAIATQTLDAAIAEVEAQQQAVAAAEAARASATTQLSYATLSAPISGRTSLDAAKVGTQISPGTPLLTTISQQEPIGVDFSLPQADIPRLADLRNRKDSTFRLRLPNDSLYDHYGQIYADDRAVNQRTGGLQVRLKFPNPQGTLRAGMNLEVEVLNRQSGQQLVVSRQSVGEQLGEYFVYQLRDSMVYRQKVKTGAKIGEQIIVHSGLDPGSVVVTDGMQGLRDSTKVKVIPSRQRETGK